MITAEPATTPVTIPVDAPTVALAVLRLAQVPPPRGSLNVAVAPWQRLKVPVIGPGAGLSVTIIVAEHPVPIRE